MCHGYIFKLHTVYEENLTHLLGYEPINPQQQATSSKDPQPITVTKAPRILEQSRVSKKLLNWQTSILLFDRFGLRVSKSDRNAEHAVKPLKPTSLS